MFDISNEGSPPRSEIFPSPLHEDVYMSIDDDEDDEDGEDGDNNEINSNDNDGDNTTDGGGGDNNAGLED